MSISKAILFAVVFICSAVAAPPRDGNSGSIDLNASDYQTMLWKFFHRVDSIRDARWNDEYGDAFGWKLIVASLNGPTHTRIFKMPGNIGTLAVPHELEMYTFSHKDEHVTIMEPAIDIVFNKPASLSELQKRFGGKDLLGRLVRLRSVIDVANPTDGVIEIEIRFGELFNHNQFEYCNGFTARVTFKVDGKTQELTYFIGSGLDPFKDTKGHQVSRPFVSENTLIDPEYGKSCEKEATGEEVFVRIY